jgi:ABC-type glycerol-3-phosphate transport system substrate-binding protein
MKQIAFIILAALIVFTQLMAHRGMAGARGGESGKRVLFWVSQPGPVRMRQVEAFNAFLAKRGISNVVVKPDFDPGARPEKIITHSVSAVLGDLVEAYGPSVQYYNDVGMLEPLGRRGPSNLLSAETGYPSLDDECVIDGEQVVFPAGVAPTCLLVNVGLLERHGLAATPFAPSLDEFESAGLAFVERANRGKPRREHFYADSVDPWVLWRSVGVGLFNETLTASALDQPETVRILKRLHRWTHELHLLPSPAEAADFSTEQSLGPVQIQLFLRGNYAHINAARWFLYSIREVSKSKSPFQVCLPPHGGFPNAMTLVRAVGFYKGSKNKDLIPLVRDFFASPEYNEEITVDYDNIPPYSRLLDTPSWRQPPIGIPQDGALNRQLLRVATDYAMAREYSPYCLTSQALKAAGRVLAQYGSGILSAEAAAPAMAKAVDEEIKGYLKRHPERRPRYEAARARQSEVDRIKASGKMVPVALVENPYSRRYFRALGRLAE